jgi:hypothetical protein
MNTLRKKLQKINHACGDCEGSGIFHIHEYPDAINVKEKCVTCSGLGYVIPLEKDCEVEMKNILGKRYIAQIISICQESHISSEILYNVIAKNNILIKSGSNIFKNLGKPSTLQDLMRALGAKDNQTTMFVDNGYLMILNDDLKRTWTKLDLSKTVETQTQEVINQLIKILS